MFSILLVWDYFLSSMPVIYRFGLFRVLVTSWNSHWFLVTILSLSLLDCTISSTLSSSSDVRLLDPSYCWKGIFFLFLSFFLLAWLCFSLLIFQIICLQYFYLFHIIPIFFYSAVCVFECIYKYFLSGISSNLLALDAMSVGLIIFGEAVLSFFFPSCFLCYRVGIYASNGILLLSLIFFIS